MELGLSNKQIADWFAITEAEVKRIIEQHNRKHKPMAKTTSLTSHLQYQKAMIGCREVLECLSEDLQAYALDALLYGPLRKWEAEQPEGTIIRLSVDQLHGCGDAELEAIADLLERIHDRIDALHEKLPVQNQDVLDWRAGFSG